MSSAGNILTLPESGPVETDAPSGTTAGRRHSTAQTWDRPALGAWALTALVFAFDLCFPLGVASAVPYTFAVLAALNARSRRLPAVLAAVCCALTVAKVILMPERGATEAWKVAANRGLAVFAIGTTLYVGLKRRRSDEDRRRAEEQARLRLAELAHMARLKTADVLAHELSQPLASVRLQADVAAEHLRLGGVAGAVEAVQEIVGQSARAGTILRGLRDWVRKAEPRMAAVDINGLVAEAARLMEFPARRAGAAIRLHPGEDLPSVFGDRVQLGQVLVNLLQNSIEALPADGAGARLVEIETRAAGDGRVVVSVRDTGTGLPPGNPDRVFDRFFTTKSGGMGLGLAICRSIVGAHGGSIRAEPAPQGGTVVSFTLAGEGSAL
jgi:signal transduction histidine kinase